ncbi:unnamed protein product, partial [Allacma fusca]
TKVLSLFCTNLHFPRRGSMGCAGETEIFTGLKRYLLAYGFNSSAPTKIICHGFMSNYKSGSREFVVPGVFGFVTKILPSPMIIRQNIFPSENWHIPFTWSMNSQSVFVGEALHL